MDDLREVIAEGDIAGLMLTNPNTLGLFDEHITEIARLVHEAGGLLYYDGANANAVLGVSRPGDMGFDIVHFNTHKTFSTPHGGGGPGAGPIVVRDSLAPFLPVPLVEKGEDGRFFFQYDRPQSIGKVRTFYGNFGVLVRAWTYIRSLGRRGPARGQRDGRAQRQLRDGGRARAARPALRRPALHARVRRLGDAAQAGRRARPGRRQAAARLRRAPADHVLPAHRRRGAHGRADGDGVARTRSTGWSRRSAAWRARPRSEPELLHEAPVTLPVRRLDEAQAARRPVRQAAVPGGRGGRRLRLRPAPPRRRPPIAASEAPP